MAVLMQIARATFVPPADDEVNDTMEWNLLRHDGHLWLVTPTGVEDLGPVDGAISEIKAFLAKEAEARRPKSIAA